MLHGTGRFGTTADELISSLINAFVFTTPNQGFKEFAFHGVPIHSLFTERFSVLYHSGTTKQVDSGSREFKLKNIYI